ncbi:MAG: tetratricopeptide repeat protein [Candidatus Eremiobacteraeota bacterium]|nr:tetratricopeptide repeat protein [Candidatus Eremiobacteraeota bacterium]
MNIYSGSSKEQKKVRFLHKHIVLFFIITFLCAPFTGCNQGNRKPGKPDPVSSPTSTSISSKDNYTPLSSNTKIPECIYEARIAVKSGDFKVAHNVLLKGLKKNPGNVEIYLALSMVHQRKKDYVNALSVCEEGLKANKDNLKLLEDKARILFEMGKYEESAEVNLSILELFRNDQGISQEIAFLARTQIAGALAKSPGSGILNNAFKEALLGLEGELKKAPGDELLRKQVGHMYREAGKYKKAAEIFKSVDEVEKENLFAPFEVGKCYFFSGNYKMAEREFEETIKKSPYNFRSYRNYGWYWMERGKAAKGNSAVQLFNLSIKNYKKALSLSTLPIDTSFQQFRTAEGMYRKWKVTKEENDRKTAISAFKKYYDLAPEWTSTDIAGEFMKDLQRNHVGDEK